MGQVKYIIIVHESLMVISLAVLCAEALMDEIGQSTSCSKAAGWFEATIATGFAAVDCSQDIWSKTIDIVRAFTNLCVYSLRWDTRSLPDCLHIVSELHLELDALGPLRTILPANQAQGTINKCLQENGERWTNPRSSILAGVRDGLHFLTFNMSIVRVYGRG